MVKTQEQVEMLLTGSKGGGLLMLTVSKGGRGLLVVVTTRGLDKCVVLGHPPDQGASVREGGEEEETQEGEDQGRGHRLIVHQTDAVQQLTIHQYRGREIASVKIRPKEMKTELVVSWQ
jgi:hypothetical protein